MLRLTWSVDQVNLATLKITQAKRSHIFYSPLAIVQAARFSPALLYEALPGCKSVANLWRGTFFKAAWQLFSLKT